MSRPANAVVPSDAPRRRSAVLQALGRLVLRLAGWRFQGDVPHIPKFVIIVAPHTSNWDFVVGVFAMFAKDLRVHWLGKDTLFRMPMNRPLRWLGGRPVKRDVPEGVVREVAATIVAESEFLLALAPEGTRKRVTEWRSGFYRVAESAHVPIVPVWLDYGRREIGIGAPLLPTGDLAGDLARLRALYSSRMARYPARFHDVNDSTTPEKS